MVGPRKVVLALGAVALACSLPGCSSVPANGSFSEEFNRDVDTVVQVFYPQYRTIAASQLKPGYEPQSPRSSKIWDLAKLARDAETEHRFVAGDLLAVSCSDLLDELQSDAFPAHVDADGTVALPLLAQRVPVRSLTTAEAERAIGAAYVAAQMIREPRVTIRTLEHSTSTVYVIGAVRKPGAYELRPDDCDPLRAIVAAGGTTEDATNVVEVRRGGKRFVPGAGNAPPGIHPAAPNRDRPAELTPVSATGPTDDQVIRFDLTQAIARNAVPLQLQNGDIVSVEQKKLRPIYVAGSVNRPGEFPMPVDRDIRVLEAVGLAYGVTTLSEPTVALVTRRPRNKEVAVIHVNLREAAKNPEANLRLMEGDIVTVVENTPSRIRKFIRSYIGVPGFGIPIP